jgi:magnesium transporter
VISARLYHASGHRDVEPSDIAREVTGKEGMLWVDVVDPTKDDLQCLQDEFALDPLAIEDVEHRFQRPKLEKYQSHDFLVAYTAQLEEVDFFVGPHWVITVRETDDSGKHWDCQPARVTFERHGRERLSPGFLIYVLLDHLVDEYFEAAERAEDVLERLENRIFSEEASSERTIQHELYEVRSRLLRFRRAVVPLREVLNTMLRREVGWVDELVARQLQDVYDHVLRVVDQVDTGRELMGNAVDAHLAIISNRMNSVMKRMTSWGAILLGATLVAGIYGMNFNHMPELSWRLGYAWALGVMGMITIVGYWYFRRKDWL